ncbi:hypothetical protein HHK36_015169 [Tetracentron sinense]|uniref:Trichome birefringence-like N-terminal domain-containing protein n=1 Tax=Tetracentron sinense TaxID=13715 RepID=A0A835DGH0_TETSI|nr:hypothetical protein HHK36_015169 [Tetracentron sinense]
MKFSHPISENFHNYKKERYMNTGRSFSFLLWLLAVLSIFIFIFLSIPNPFTVTPQEHLTQSTTLSTKPEKDDEKCDLFVGNWIPDLNGSLYTNWSCSTIPNSKNCGKHGRKDVDFVNWRWKPDGCELPRFEPKTFLRIVQGKTLAFIGDSIARNQMESLLCLLSQDETPTDMYKDAEDRFRTWYFPSQNFTLMVFWSKFLVAAEERVINGSLSGIFDLHLDKVDEKWANKLPGVDYAIISDVHWFFRENYYYEGGNLLGCAFCNEENVTDLGFRFALPRVFRTALKYINDCKECSRELTLLRTFSPAHFENGEWNTGGNCKRTSPRTQGEGGTQWELGLGSIQIEEVERARKEGHKRFGVLEVTRAMMMRPDGHPGLHWNNEEIGMKGFSDCVHWCLPGPIDAWNDLLQAVLKKEG